MTRTEKIKKLIEMTNEPVIIIDCGNTRYTLFKNCKMTIYNNFIEILKCDVHTPTMFVEDVSAIIRIDDITDIF